MITNFMNGDSQLTFTCSKSRTEVVEKSVKYVRSDVVLVFLLLTLNIFHTFFLLSLLLTLNK